MKLWGRLDWDDVRGACIAHEWYTCGTSGEYQKLRDYVNSWREVNLAENENAWDMCEGCAMDIKARSNTGYGVEDIAQTLLRKVNFYFVEG